MRVGPLSCCGIGTCMPLPYTVSLFTPPPGLHNLTLWSSVLQWLPKPLRYQGRRWSLPQNNSAQVSTGWALRPAHDSSHAPLISRYFSFLYGMAWIWNENKENLKCLYSKILSFTLLSKIYCGCRVARQWRGRVY